jgi:hypothetical protein
LKTVLFSVTNNTIIHKRAGNMKKILIVTIIIILIIVSLAFLVPSVYDIGRTEEKADCFFGVSFCGNTTAEAKLLIDRVKDYTNLLVLQSGPVSWNETATNEVSNYAVEAGLNIIVYFGDLSTRAFERIKEEKGEDLFWRLSWISTAEEKWGDSFLGVYYYDESGGIWLDTMGNWLDYLESQNITSPFLDPTYDSVAELFNAFLPRDRGYQALKNNSLSVFASDYALYWFDYKMGYDTIFAQVGWNHTQEQDISLVRGAANLQNKSWGTIVTWKYDHPPYIDTAENIANQMLVSYEAGAEYIVLFNYPTYPENNAYGVMTDAHFEALEKFWKDTIKNPTVIHGSKRAEAALVLPKNYGWGMRNPQDTIWAFWGPDENSEQIWKISRQLLAQYGTRLDIVFHDPDFPVTGKYVEIYYWNQTITTNHEETP